MYDGDEYYDGELDFAPDEWLTEAEMGEWAAARAVEDAPEPEPDDWHEPYDLPEPDEPDLDMQYEHDSAMMAVGWGTDEDYGYDVGDEGW